MAALVRVSITDPQNILDTYGTGALYRIERGSSSAMSDASEITAAEVSNDGTEYEYRDQTGVAGTHWYRLRYSKASPSVASDYSGYGAVFQAGALSGEVITLETFKTWADIDDTVDDPWLPLAIGSCNRAIIGPSGVGLDLGPNVHLIKPQGYMAFLNLWKDAALILTDSGGLQEETTALGVPCVTMRENTERPITLIEGTNTLTGPVPDKIMQCFADIMSSGGKRGRIPEYWDGRAAPRIADTLRNWLDSDCKV